MKHTAHTPGPWEVWQDTERQDVLTQITGNRDDGCIVVREMMHQIYSENYETDEMLANARLIAAAPDLLEALRIICNEFETTSNKDFVEVGYKSIQRGLKAITKATE